MSNSTNDTGEAELDPATEAYYENISDGVWTYGSPFILVVGTVGNILSFLVMNRPRLRPTTFSIYLRTTAVCDTTYLWLGLAQKWGSTIWDFDYAELNDALCRTREFLYFTFGDMAIWMVLALTLDRTITVLRASTRPNFSIPQLYAFLTVGLITVMAAGKNMHMFWTRALLAKHNQTASTQRSGCNELEEYDFFEEDVRPWIAMFTVNIIPVGWLLLCNLLIIWKLLQLRKQQVGHIRASY